MEQWKISRTLTQVIEGKKCCYSWILKWINVKRKWDKSKCLGIKKVKSAPGHLINIV
jgi:hypothetical protein